MFVPGKWIVLLFVLGFFSLSFSQIENKKHHKHNCTRDRIQFGISAHDFVLCTIQHAESVEYCRNCGLNYGNVTEKYNVLLTDVDKSDNETCKSKLFDRNRLNILEQIYASLSTLWEMGSCSNCYERNNQSDYQTLSNLTITFFDDFTNFTNCLKNESDVCINCVGNYERMNGVYDLIKKDTQDNICFDIKDAMNKTRLHWSKDYKCCKDRKSSLTTFIAISSVIGGLFPLLFYSGFVFFGWRQRQYQILSDMERTSASEQQNEQPLTSDSEVNPTSTNLMDVVDIIPSTAQLSLSNENRSLVSDMDLLCGDSSDDEILSK